MRTKKEIKQKIKYLECFVMGLKCVEQSTYWKVKEHEVKEKIKMLQWVLEESEEELWNTSYKVLLQ